uniref:Sex-determining region Y protein n=1 Tax=Panagrellus redivivus TaxID=6233 RepID=A0A7E4VT76_PANRE
MPQTSQKNPATFTNERLKKNLKLSAYVSPSLTLAYFVYRTTEKSMSASPPSSVAHSNSHDAEASQLDANASQSDANASQHDAEESQHDGEVDHHDTSVSEHDDHHDADDSQVDPDASHLDIDESSCISTASNAIKGPIDFSDLPSTIEIHPQNGHLKGSSSTQQFIKRPLNAYMIWTVEQRGKIIREPRQKMNEISRQMGEVWKKMSDAAKAPYFEQAKKYAEEHKKALKENPNLAYIPSRKKMRMSKPDKEDLLSNPPSSPDPSIPASPAPSGRGQSFAPMSPTPTPQHMLGRSPVAHVTPGSSFILSPSPQNTPQSGSKFSFLPPYPPNGQQQQQFETPDSRYMTVPRTPLPAPTQQLLPPPQPVGNMMMPAPAPYEYPQMTQQPMPYRSLASQPNNQPCPQDMQLSANQIRERYYSALCAPLVPQLYEFPSTLKDPNYYYDLHLQVYKRAL